MNFLNIFISPSSLLTGGQLTPPNPEMLEKVQWLFLHRLLQHLLELKEKLKHAVCLCLSISAAVVGGVLAEWLRASGCSGGGLAGVARRDTPPLCAILRVGEEMWRLLR